MGSSEKKGKVLYLVKWKDWPLKKNRTRELFDDLFSVGIPEELENFTEIILMHGGTLVSKPNNKFFLPRRFFSLGARVGCRGWRTTAL
jgi:hypothetical protein